MRKRSCNGIVTLMLISALGSLLLTSLGAQPSSAGALATSAAAGRAHSCAITRTGGVKCWGYNYFGQLGDGVRSDETTPVDVANLSGVVAVAAGANHTCALTAGGGVKCWGDGDYGQLGDGSGNAKLKPKDVLGLTSGVSAIAVGYNDSCVLTDAGGVKCWGEGDWGELGNGEKGGSPTPVDVTGLTSGVAAISAGSNHTCVLTNAGGVKCWGSNSSGQLGDGSYDDSLVPVDVVGLTSGVASVVASPLGFHTCAVLVVGDVKCWGTNFYGELGDGTTTESPSPVDVSGLSGVASITLGTYHSCALTAGGGATCWGKNDFGQLGDGSTSPSPLPIDVSGLTAGVISLSAGADHTCGITTTGVAKCWGLNENGQLGDGTTHDRKLPTNVASLPGVPKIFELKPASGSIGSDVTIVGYDFKHAKKVTFHGVIAKFDVVSNTKIIARVPKTAASGYVHVSTPGGTATSSVPFKVV